MDDPQAGPCLRGPGALAYLSQRLRDSWSSWSWVLALTLMVLTFHRQVLLGILGGPGDLYYPGDIARIYVPQRAALSRALAHGGLPWWSDMLALGYPLLAEGEIGAFYPPNLLIFGLLVRLGLSVERGVSLSIVLHYLLAAWGTWGLLRALRLRPSSAVLGALTFSCAGFLLAHLSHVSILCAAAWLPWLCWLTLRLFRTEWPRPAATLFALALLTGCHLLAGHAQTSMIVLLAVGGWAAWTTPTLRSTRWLQKMLGKPKRPYGGPRRRPLVLAAAWLTAVSTGTLFALPHLLPAYELAQLSQRAGGLDLESVTDYSFHPLLSATFVSPFLRGNPYPSGSVELMSYVGLLPLVLAAAAFVRRPNAGMQDMRLYALILSVLGLAMALGRWNPLYRALASLPPWSFFRAPSRYLLWTSLGLAVLAAYGADALLARCRRAGHPAALLGTAAAVLTALGVAFLIPRGEWLGTEAARDVSALIEAWRWLPLVLACGCAALGLAARKSPPALWQVLAVSLTFADLLAYGAVLGGTYNVTWPREAVAQAPSSLEFLTQEVGEGRVYTKNEILPALSVQRASLYPNMGLHWGVRSANLYLPLSPRPYGDYVAHLDADRLNKMAVSHVLIPQLLPVDAANELYDVENPFATLPLDRWLEVGPLSVREMVVESYLSHAADLKDDEVAAELWLREEDGQEQLAPLRAGLETAEWAYLRDDVARVVAHDMPPVADTFPARSGFPPRDHLGQIYAARWRFAPPLSLTALRLSPRLPAAHVRIERVTLRLTDGREVLLGHLLGLGDHEIVYRSDEVLAYRNLDALPRAYRLSRDQVTSAGEGMLALPSSLHAQDVASAQIDGVDGSVRVVTTGPSPAYLILTDLDYPGWTATVDGVPAEIFAADGVFRAVEVPSGEAVVHFGYRPLPERLLCRSSTD